MFNKINLDGYKVLDSEWTNFLVGGEILSYHGYREIPNIFQTKFIIEFRIQIVLSSI